MYVFVVGQYSDTDNSWKNAFEQLTLFLRTFHDQNRRREVVDQCSLWKERPQSTLYKLDFLVLSLKLKNEKF